MFRKVYFPYQYTCIKLQKFRNIIIHYHPIKEIILHVLGILKFRIIKF